jgi:F-type H+-transporting ATPase subunit b
MKRARRKHGLFLATSSSVRMIVSLAVLAWTALPALAQEQGAPDPADSVAGSIFRWLNFALVLGAIIYLIRKAGAPYFRQNAQAIGQSIRQAAEERAAAERELSEATQKLATIDREIQAMHQAGVSESAAQAERIRALAKNEVERIRQAARAEIAASERAAALELRGATARLATEQASALVRERMNSATEQGLFRNFLREIERSAA